MFELIFQRQSIRKYKPEESEQMKQEIETAINDFGNKHLREKNEAFA